MLHVSVYYLRQVEILRSVVFVGSLVGSLTSGIRLVQAGRRLANSAPHYIYFVTRTTVQAPHN